MGEASEPGRLRRSCFGGTPRVCWTAIPFSRHEQAGEILKAVPAHPVAMLLLGVARRTGGRCDGLPLMP